MSRWLIPLALLVIWPSAAYSQKPGKPGKPNKPSAPLINITLDLPTAPAPPSANPGLKLGHLSKADPAHPGARGLAHHLSPEGERQRGFAEQEYHQKRLCLQVEKEQEMMRLPPLSRAEWAQVRHAIDLKYQALESNLAQAHQARLHEIETHHTIIVIETPPPIIVQPVAPTPPVVLPFPDIDIRIRN